MATVAPAKMTARPAVEPAMTDASTGLLPRASSCRNRMTMNSA